MSIDMTELILKEDGEKIADMKDMNQKWFTDHFPEIANLKTMRESTTVLVNDKPYTYAEFLKFYEKEIVRKLARLMAQANDTTKLIGEMVDARKGIEAEIAISHKGSLTSKETRNSYYGRMLEPGLFSARGAADPTGDVKIDTEPGGFVEFLRGAKHALELKSSLFGAETNVIVVGELQINFSATTNDANLNSLMKFDTKKNKLVGVAEEIKEYCAAHIRMIDIEKAKLYKSLHKMQDFIMVSTKESQVGVNEKTQYLYGIKRVELFLILKIDELLANFVEMYNNQDYYDKVFKGFPESEDDSRFGISQTNPGTTVGPGYVSGTDVSFSDGYRVTMAVQTDVFGTQNREVLKLKDSYEIITRMFDEGDFSGYKFRRRAIEKKDENKLQSLLKYTKMDWAWLIAHKDEEWGEYPQGPETPVFSNVARAKKAKE